MTKSPQSITRIYLGYLGVRLLLFAIAVLICVLCGLSGLLAVIVALVVSGLVAYPLAKRQRDDIARAFEERRRR